VEGESFLIVGLSASLEAAHGAVFHLRLVLFDLTVLFILGMYSLT
jgi:hypothetical protein